MTLNEKILSPSGIPRRACPISRCAVDETGINSVRPWIMPRMKAWMKVMVILVKTKYTKNKRGRFLTFVYFVSFVLNSFGVV